MNPVTEALMRQLEDDNLAEFVAHWDELEEVVIRVYRSNGVAHTDEAAYLRIQAWLGAHYSHFREPLKRFWKKTLIAGQPTADDPFSSVLEAAEAHAFVDNWRIMQTLPAAREALNEWLRELIDSR